MRIKALKTLRPDGVAAKPPKAVADAMEAAGVSVIFEGGAYPKCDAALGKALVKANLAVEV